MATVNIGSLKFNWKGAYNGSTAYSVDDVTSYNGSSYICILASTGNLPTNTTYFQPMATKGTDGTDVSTTLTTQGDLLYRDGSGLQRLAKGTAAQVLKMNTAANAPEWGNLSSDYVRIQTTSLSSPTTNWSVDGWVSSTYKHYCIYFDNMQTASNGGWWYARFNIAGSTWTGSDYRYAGNSAYSGSHGYSSGNPDNYFRLCQNSTDDNRAGAGRLMIYSPAETNRYTFFHAETGGGDGATNPHALVVGGFIQKTEAITGITIIDNGGNNVNKGTMTIYGIKG